MATQYADFSKDRVNSKAPKLFTNKQPSKTGLGSLPNGPVLQISGEPSRAKQIKRVKRSRGNQVPTTEALTNGVTHLDIDGGNTPEFTNAASNKPEDGTLTAKSSYGSESSISTTGQFSHRSDSALSHASVVLSEPSKPVIFTAQQMLEKSEETEFKEVYELHLRALHLTKIEHLNKFPKLRLLDVSSNFLTDLSSLKDCKDLRELKLYDNQLTEVMHLEGLTELSTLQLQHNRLRSLGKAFSHLRKLRCLRLDCNKLHTLEPKELVSCTQLSQLDLSYNRLEDISVVNCLPNLVELNVSFNNIRTVKDLSRCKKLSELDLSGNRLTALSGLQGLGRLKILNISNNNLKSLKGITPLAKLEELDVSKNFLANCALLDTLECLEILNLSSNRIASWDDVAKLQWLTSLREVSLAKNPFSLEGGDKIEYVQALPRLMPLLQIVDGSNVQDGGIQEGGDGGDILRISTMGSLNPRPGSMTTSRLTPTANMRPPTASGSQPLSATGVRPQSALGARPPSASGARPSSASGVRPPSALSARPTSAMSTCSVPLMNSPLMRPMTATAEISSYQVESQLSAIEERIQSFEALEQTFTSLRSSLQSLPPKSAAKPAESASAAGATKKRGSRSRIMDAKLFAENFL